MQLRDYQRNAIDRLRSVVMSGKRKVCLVMPTGTGKSLTGSAIIHNHLGRKTTNSCVVYVHRQELAIQFAGTLGKIGVPTRTVIAGQVHGDRDARVTVAMVQSVDANPELAPTGSMVLFDECHHVAAKTWRSIAAKYDQSVVLGLTATPERADGKGLGDVFDALEVILSTEEAVEQGYLVPCRVYAPDEYTPKLSADPTEVYLTKCQGQKALVFATNCTQSRDLVEAIAKHGFRAEHVDGKTSDAERKRIIRSFASGETRVLSSVGVLTEGFDDPSAEVAIIARGADHAGTWLQIVGRVLRLSPGKTRADVYDLRGIVHKHGLPTDPRTFSLGGKPISHDSDRLATARCKLCGAVTRASVTKCPVCGHERPPPKSPEIIKQQIKAYVAKETHDQRNDYRAKLEAIARAKGYKRGWVEHRMRAKYDVEDRA